MGSTVAIRRCFEYNTKEIDKHIAWLWRESDGPDPEGKKILLKPNILMDADPVEAITTHPVVVDSVIRYLQSRGATVLVGDSPTIDNQKFTGEKCGIRQVVEKNGAKWVRFNDGSVIRKVGNNEIKITAFIEKVDLIISISKLKNHELMIFSGAMKNIFGFVPGFNKAMQHARHPDRYRFGKFFVDLEEAIKPHFHIMDGIMGLEGPGPGNGYPRRVNVLLASVNPLALDIVASRIVGYDPLEIPTNRIALERGLLLRNQEEILIMGPDPDTIVIRDFKRIHHGSEAGIILKYVKRKILFLKRFDKRPFFNGNLCIGCSKCIDICPTHVLCLDGTGKNRVLINDAGCIRCYCCSEVCTERAVEIKRKIFNVSGLISCFF